MPRKHPPAQPHGELRELFDGVWFVTGRVRMFGPLTFSRNMTVVRDGDALTLIGSMRLSDDGLAALEKLGAVKSVIRLAAFHGMDDPFYKERYGATVYAVEGSAYATGFKPGTPDPSKAYFQPDVWMNDATELPVSDAKLITIRSAKPPEGLMLLQREGGILVSGDALQNWGEPDEHFSISGRLMMKRMGFIRPYNVGPGWLDGAKPDRAEVKALLDLPFEHVLPVHGAEVIGAAKEKYRPRIEAL